MMVFKMICCLDFEAFCSRKASLTDIYDRTGWLIFIYPETTLLSRLFGYGFGLLDLIPKIQFS